MVLGLDFWEQAVLKKWKTMKFLYRFMDKELEKINRRCFGGELSIPQIHVKRMKFSKSLGGGYFGADYKPPKKNRPATIGIFPLLLLEKKDIIAGLAHELIHHWEFLVPDGEIPWPYPEKIDEIVQSRFRSSGREKNWRQTHSSRFLSKSWEIAKYLNLPIQEFLFKG